MTELLHMHNIMLYKLDVTYNLSGLGYVMNVTTKYMYSNVTHATYV